MTPASRERSRVRSPIMLISATAWILLVIHPSGMMMHARHVYNGSLEMLLTHNPPGSIARGWSLMLIAMMLPLLTAPMRHVSNRSFSHRRVRAIVLFSAGYATIWMAAGTVLVTLAIAIRALVENTLVLAALSITMALVWQFSPFKQHCLNHNHDHPPLSAFGVAADLDALVFGLVHGLWCVGSCWGFMLIPMIFSFSAGHLIAVTVVSLWMWGEHLERPVQPSWCLRGPAKSARLILAQARILVVGST